MKLGWRWSRPNDFTSPDQRPLRDSFQNLQLFMTWPHVRVTVEPLAATTTTFSAKPINVVDDPYSLVVGDTIKVPQEHQSWMLLAHVYIQIGDAGGTGRYLAGLHLNGASLFSGVGESYTVAGTPHRPEIMTMWPVNAGDTLEVAAASPAASGVVQGSAVLMFLPLG